MKENTSELQVTNLSAAYNKIQILHDINLTVSQGEFVCLCGPNGAGKSTLLSVMAGVPDAKLKVEGEFDLSKLPRRELARTIAYLQQNEYSEWDFTVHDYVLQGRYAYTKYGHYTANDHSIADGVLSDCVLLVFA